MAEFEHFLNNRVHRLTLECTFQKLLARFPSLPLTRGRLGGGSLRNGKLFAKHYTSDTTAYYEGE